MNPPCVTYTFVPARIRLNGSDPQPVNGCSQAGPCLADLWIRTPTCAPRAVSQPSKCPLSCDCLPLTGERTVWSRPGGRRALWGWTTILSTGCWPWHFGRHPSFSVRLCRYTRAVVLAELLSKEKISLWVNVCQSKAFNNAELDKSTTLQCSTHCAIPYFDEEWKK